MTDCDVLIVGAGPVGALAGLLLVREGLKVTLIEKEPAILQSPRAIVYLPQVNGVLEDAGILADIRRAGLVMREGVVWRDSSDHSVLAGIDPYALQPEDNPQGHLRAPALLGQHHFADIVLENLKQRGGQVYFGQAFQSFEQDSDTIRVATVNSKGEGCTFTTKFLLGTDGGRSSVRKAMEVQFDGFTHDVSFMAINLRYPQMKATGFGDAQFLVDPKTDVGDSGFAIILRTGSDDVWRCAYGDTAKFTENELKTRVSMKLKKILPLHPDPDQYEILQAQPYRIHQRCASSYVRGRVLLAGDAAHLNNPVGGFGLNTGLLDARAAVTAICEASGFADAHKIEQRLKQYSDIRRAAFLEFTNPVTIDNLRRLVEKSDDADENLRASFFASMKNPQFQRGMQLAMNKMGLGVPGL